VKALHNLIGWNWGQYGEAVFFVQGAYRNAENGLKTFKWVPTFWKWSMDYLPLNQRIGQPECEDYWLLFDTSRLQKGSSCAISRVGREFLARWARKRSYNLGLLKLIVQSIHRLLQATKNTPSIYRKMAFHFSPFWISTLFHQMMRGWCWGRISSLRGVSPSIWIE